MSILTKILLLITLALAVGAVFAGHDWWKLLLSALLTLLAAAVSDMDETS